MPGAFAQKALEILGDIGTNFTNICKLEDCIEYLVPFVGAGLSSDLGYPMWAQFLSVTAGEFGCLSDVNRFLAKHQYEEAAELLSKLREQSLDDALQRQFDHRILRRPIRNRPVCHLVRIARGLVFTTNFDRVLETAFEDAGRPFDAVFPGSRIRRASRAIQLNQPSLLKLHGDYLDPESRVLTLSEYAAEYGSPEPNSVDLSRPLPIILAQVLGARPLLFLGCSLKRDRTTRVIAEITKRSSGVMHFALLAESENTARRCHELDTWRIRPLFYAEHRYEKVEQFLACVADALLAGWNAGGSPHLFPPPAPAHVVFRSEEFNRAKNTLLQRNGSSRLSRSVALVGPGGHGKTTLAKLLCADANIQQSFPQGRVWIESGQTPNILHHLLQLYKVATGGVLATVDEVEAGVRIAQALRGQSILLVLDDIWQRSHLRAFLDATPECAHLITTSNADILDPEVSLIRVEEMSSDQAAVVLLRGVGEPPADFQPALDLARCLGHCALLLELANAKLRIMLRRRGESILTAIAAVRRQYQEHGLEQFDSSVSSWRDIAAVKSITASFELLDEYEQRRYLDLGIFPENEAIPAIVAAELWGVSSDDAEVALCHLDDLSLLKYFANDKAFHVHGVLHGWLRRRLTEQETQARLIDSWGDPYRLPHTYAWRWIGWHLKRAGRTDQLQTLLLDPSWIEIKLKQSGLDSLIAEYHSIESSESHFLAERALIQSAHVLCIEPDQLISQLYGRLLDSRHPELVAFCARLQNKLGCLVPLWPSLNQATSPLLRTLHGHTSSVSALVSAGDGHTLVSGSWDGTIRFWDLVSGREVRALRGRSDGITCLALSTSHHIVASASGDRTVKVWSLDTGREVLALLGHEGIVYSLGISPDGRTLVSGSWDKTIKSWDLTLGSEVRTLRGHQGPVESLALSSDGKTLYSGSWDNSVKVWHLDSGSEVGTFYGHSSQVESLIVSSDGRTLISASGDKTIKLWNLLSGTEVRTLRGHTAGVTSLALSPDECTLASASWDGTIKLWNLETGCTIRSLQGHPGGVYALALEDSGRTLCSGGEDNNIKLWHLGCSEKADTWHGPIVDVESMALSADGGTLVSCSLERRITVWDLIRDRAVWVLHGHSAHVESLALSRDARILVSTSWDGSIKVWDLVNGRELHNLSARGFIMSAVVNADGSILASSSADGTITVWNLQTASKALSLRPRTDASHIARGGARSHLSRVRDNILDGRNHSASEGVSSLGGIASLVTPLAISANGRTLFSGYSDGTITARDLASPKEVVAFRGHTDGVTNLVLSADSGKLVSCSKDGTIRLWDVASACDKRVLQHDNIVALALSSDGSLLASGSTDGKVTLWDLNRATEMGSFLADASIRQVAMSGNGDLIGCSDALGRLQLFEIRRLALSN
ncbi:MAG: SIR2 family protein [Candidatus Korobacteraceae bacterium]